MIKIDFRAISLLQINCQELTKHPKRYYKNHPNAKHIQYMTTNFKV